MQNRGNNKRGFGMKTESENVCKLSVYIPSYKKVMEFNGYIRRVYKHKRKYAQDEKMFTIDALKSEDLRWRVYNIGSFHSLNNLLNKKVHLHDGSAMVVGKIIKAESECYDLNYPPIKSLSPCGKCFSLKPPHVADDHGGKPPKRKINNILKGNNFQSKKNNIKKM